MADKNIEQLYLRQAGGQHVGSDQYSNADVPPLLREDMPWIYPPPGAIEYDQVFTGVLAAAPTGDVAIGSGFQMPLGYDGIILRASHGLAGMSWNTAASIYNEGTTDLIFWMRIDNTPVQNYSRILIPFGSPNQPRLLKAGIPLKSNQTFRYMVNSSNAGQDGKRVIAVIGGYYWPRKKEQPVGGQGR